MLLLSSYSTFLFSFSSYLFAHDKVSPSQRTICADILIELEACVIPYIHSRSGECGAMSHSCHQTNARYLEHLCSIDQCDQVPGSDNFTLKKH